MFDMTSKHRPTDKRQAIEVHTRLVDGRRLVGEWVHGRGVPSVDHPDRALYLVHGGGYALCSPRTHRRLTGWLSTMTGLPVFVVELYCAAIDPAHPRLTFEVSAGRRLPPVLIQAGGAESGR